MSSKCEPVRSKLYQNSSSHRVAKQQLNYRKVANKQTNKQTNRQIDGEKDE